MRAKFAHTAAFLILFRRITDSRGAASLFMAGFPEPGGTERQLTTRAWALRDGPKKIS
jgi:hypothetical protein